MSGEGTFVPLSPECSWLIIFALIVCAGLLLWMAGNDDDLDGGAPC